MAYRRALNPHMVTLGELSLALGISPDTIKKRRREDPDHPLYGKAAFRSGSARNSLFLWWRSDVEAYMASIGQRVDWSVLGRPEGVASIPTPTREPAPTSDLALVVADIAEGFAQVLLDVAAKARAGEYDEGARQSRS